MRSLAFAAFAALGLIVPATASLAEGVAIFPIKLLDTSHEARDQMADHTRRRALVADILAAQLPGAIPVEAATVAAACTPETTECLMAVARDAGADQALLIVFQKTSTLIIQIFVNLVDVDSAELIDSRSLNFRGDTDEAWERAARFLAGQLRAE